MSSMTLLILGFSFMILPPTVFQRAPLGNGEYALQREQVHQHAQVQPAPVLIVLEGPAGTSEKKKSGRSEETSTTAEKEKTTTPQQGEKNGPLKDFVPSEKIDADKAVDFPADI